MLRDAGWLTPRGMAAIRTCCGQPAMTAMVAICAFASAGGVAEEHAAQLGGQLVDGWVANRSAEQPAQRNTSRQPHVLDTEEGKLENTMILGLMLLDLAVLSA